MSASTPHRTAPRPHGDGGGSAVPAPAAAAPSRRILRTREDAEEVERRALAPWATLSAEAGPRLDPEPEDRFRTALQRDRDRILHASSLRALQHKTQVFVVHESEHLRTRLTHTIEVAQIARSVASFLGANQDLAEAVALAHDLGHAPFGHAGEEELSALMEERGLPPFDHNHASLRIVTDLEQRAPGRRGLNLTFATREGIARHETAYDRPAEVRAYYVTRQPGIEAQIANAADPIAYTTHDLEDALRLRFFEEEELTALGLGIVTDAWERAHAETSGLPAADRPRARAALLHRDILNRALTALLDETERRLAALGPRPTAACVRAAEHPVVAFPEAIGPEVDALRRFLHQRVYRHPTVLDMCSKGRRILRALFEHYTERPNHLPRRIQSRFGAGGPEAADTAARAQVVCDYLASLTDRGAMDLYRVLFDPYERTLARFD